MVDAFATDELTSREAIADPYAYFGRLRETDPVHWNDLAETWVVTRYRDLVWLIRNHEQFSSQVFIRDHRPTYPRVDETQLHHDAYIRHLFTGAFITHDRPEHLRMRQAIHRSFTPQAVERWRSQIRATTEELIGEQLANGGMEVKEAVATPLPLHTVGTVMGLPESDSDFLRSLAARFTTQGFATDRMASVASGLRELEEYFGPLLDARAAHPGDDLVSLLADAEKEGVFTRAQVLGSVVHLMIAGHETTQNLICNGLLAFIRNPDQWELFQADPGGLVASATEECLRYDPPLKGLSRVTTEAISLGGKVIPPGDRVMWVIASANRDPEQFPDPDRFDIRRTPNAHVAFGGGIHHCIGAALARLEGQEAFLALARTFRRLHLDGSVEYVPNLIDRSVRALHVSWDAADVCRAVVH